MSLSPLRPLLALTLLASTSAGFSRTLRVPADKPSIQAAIDAAKDGDVVLISPGTYRESLKLAGKRLTLASHFLESQDPKHVESTVLDVMGADNKRGASILVVDKASGSEATIVGLTFRGASHAVTIRGKAELTHNRFTHNGDALSFESGSGVVRFNTFEDNTDDGIDMDGASAALIEDNLLRNNRDDGIEVRLHKYNGPTLEITLRRNLIVGNGEDGLQLIDYAGKSDRHFRVEGNVFARNAMAAIGSMKDGVTKENYAGADLIERVEIVNNTIVGGEYGITGGDNMVLLNNVITGVAKVALKRVHGDSAAGKNLLWKNGTDVAESDLPEDRFVTTDPLLDDSFKPRPGSPCIDAGEASLDFNGETLTLPAGNVRGSAPDLGAFEVR